MCYLEIENEFDCRMPLRVMQLQNAFEGYFQTIALVSEPPVLND
jgi:hypothetical protein